MQHNLKILIYTICIALIACSEKYFTHDIKSGATPWTQTPTRSLDPDDQFTFAIIGDLNSGQRAGVIQVAAQQLRLLKPKFILSIGDLIEGGGEDSVNLQKQYDEFDGRMAKAGAPLFHVGGNHDLTSPRTRSLWEKRYGRRYYHFVYENVLFLVVDSEDYTEKRFTEIFHARNRAIALLDSGKVAQARAMHSLPTLKRSLLSMQVCAGLSCSCTSPCGNAKAKAISTALRPRYETETTRCSTDTFINTDTPNEMAKTTS